MKRPFSKAPRFSKAEVPKDLGFGSVVANESRQRLMNRDGTFNVERAGMRLRESLSPYHGLLTMSWGSFLSLVAAGYLLVNLLFAALYFSLGPASIEAPAGGLVSGLDFFGRCFFFSVHTFSTIGYGHLLPVGWAANLLVTLQAMVGVVSVALVTGLVFARFSRPTAKILFSDVALIAPYRDGLAFEFRVANQRRAELLEVEIKVFFAWFEQDGERRMRRFEELPLERRRVSFFPLAWTVVHPIDKASPLWQKTPEGLSESEGEFVVLLTGLDDASVQSVHARYSYKPDEVVWNARFSDIYVRSRSKGGLAVDISRLNEVLQSDGRD